MWHTLQLSLCSFKLNPFLLQLQTIKPIVDSHSFKSPESDEPRRVQVLDLYCLTRFERAKVQVKGLSIKD